ncbi:MAG: hypothetical protein KDB50_03615 [Mycobacterium sp.]|nr:hypothetical protein [Mycobacterium sp.]
MDNLLAYIDQGSFLALRAFGHEPLGQYVWVYEHDIDIDRVRQLHRNLGDGLLGRRIERSPLPFGRHRWVAAPHQAPLDVAPVPRPAADLSAWMDEQAMIPVDPERGPAWRMAVLPFDEGGGAVTMIVSHSVGDAGASIVSLLEATHGIKRELGYPPPQSRSYREAVRQDLAVTRKSLPEMAKALKVGAQLARENSSAPKRAARPEKLRGGALTIRPSVAAVVDAEIWDERATALGGSSNALMTAFAARIAFIRGYADEAGRVTVQLPVSQRTQTDNRANALTGISIETDARVVNTSLAPIRAELKAALSGLAEEEHKLIASLPLTPFTPKWLVRRLASAALGTGTPVGSSSMGEVFADVIRPDGTDAEFFWARGVEWPITKEGLDQRGDSLFVGSGRVKGNVVICVVSWQVNGANTREELIELVRQGLADFDVTATFV